MSIVDDLIEHFGGISETAHAMKVDRQLIDFWRKRGFIPFKRGEEVEAATCGKITAVHVWTTAANARHH